MANVMTLTQPLLRQTVGFDRLNDMFESLMRDATEGFDTYPPYNIEKSGEDEYRIVMAVAGFDMSDLEIVLHDGVLTVSGNNQGKEEDGKVQILHRGIASRSFERTFQLADYIQVTGASMKDGLLTINLVREIPEEKKPRSIQIENATRQLENKSKKK